MRMRELGDKGWKTSTFEKEQKKVRDALIAISEKSTERLNYCLVRFQLLEGEQKAILQLRCYIYIIFALVHHEKYGGLSKRQIQRLSRTADAILKIQGIRTSSKLAFLHGDLHLVLSQIARKEGGHWKAAWGQQVAVHLSHRSRRGGKGFEALAMAIRSLRLGHAQLAIQNLVEAERLDLPPQSLIRTRIEHIKALRLSQKLSQAKVIITKTLSLKALPKSNRLELEWERLCCEVPNKGNLTPLVLSVLKKHPHHSPSYILECFLWTRVTESRDYLDRFPTARRLAKDSAVDFKTEGFFFTCVQTIERCYDYSIPYIRRLEALGRLLTELNKLPTIDKELLVWAAAVRWLSRSKARSLAALVLSEYHALSLRLSKGKMVDVFGLMEDITKRDWFNKKLELTDLNSK